MPLRGLLTSKYQSRCGHLSILSLNLPLSDRIKAKAGLKAFNYNIEDDGHRLIRRLNPPHPRGAPALMFIWEQPLLAVSGHPSQLSADLMELQGASKHRQLHQFPVLTEAWWSG